MSEEAGKPPVVVVSEETSVTSGTAVQEKLISAARVFSNLLKPTYGPRGLDKMLYKTKGRVPEGDYMIPLGVADIKRAGKDVTLVTYSRQVLNALEAAKILAGEGIDVEVVDLRSLKPLDTQAIIKSVQKTGRFVGVTEAYENSSFINEVMAVVNDQAFDWLDAPMVRVAAANVPVPRAEILEDLAIPNVQRIVDACRKVVS